MKKRDCNDNGKKMDEVSNHQLLPTSVKAGDSIRRDEKIEKRDYLKFLPTSLKTSNCINHDRKLDERTQHLLSKSPPMINYICPETFLFATEQVPPKISSRRNSSFIKEGSTTRPDIGTFNRIESPDQEHDGILSKDCTQSPRYQNNGNHKESGDSTLKEIPSEHRTKTSLQNHSDFVNYLESQQQEISEISNRYYPPSFATIAPDSLIEPYRIFNDSLRKDRKIKTPRTKVKIDGSPPHNNSDSFNHAESLDHEADAASNNNRTPSPATVGRNFMDYLVANCSHGTFNPHPNKLAAPLSSDPEEGCESTYVFNDKSTPSSSSYKLKAPNPIIPEESNNLHHLNDQETCSARKCVRRYKEAKVIRRSSAKMSDLSGVRKNRIRKMPAGGNNKLAKSHKIMEMIPYGVYEQTQC